MNKNMDSEMARQLKSVGVLEKKLKKRLGLLIKKSKTNNQIRGSGYKFGRRLEDAAPKDTKEKKKVNFKYDEKAKQSIADKQDHPKGLAEAKVSKAGIEGKNPDIRLKELMPDQPKPPVAKRSSIEFYMGMVFIFIGFLMLN